jgi:hypothetical protein
MQLDSVSAGLTRPPSAGGELRDSLVNLRNAHALGFEAVGGIGLVSGTEPFLELDAADVALTPTVAELDDKAAIVLMYLPNEFTPEGNALVTIDGGVVG